jgi:hypothetical protein
MKKRTEIELMEWKIKHPVHNFIAGALGVIFSIGILLCLVLVPIALAIWAIKVIFGI